MARGLAPADLLDDWLDAGVRLIQLRAKALSLGPMLALAERLAARCAAADATFIVNDRADVARLCGAAGVHVGQDDLSPDEVRRIAPGLSQVGLSTHSDSQVEAGIRSVATYLAVGPVFHTRTKANPGPVVGLAGVRSAAEALRCAARPLVAIGGITLETAPEVMEAGAHAVAVTSDLMVGNVSARAREFVLALR